MKHFAIARNKAVCYIGNEAVSFIQTKEMIMPTEQTNVRLEKGVKAWLKGLAEKQERSQTWIINRLLKEAMQKESQSAAQ
ncbi:MAG: hypothetical protein CL583_07390 [Alteromonadaceae bacterium]|nr:hypothetical protein [Alteromonadaceae bacterium]